MSDPGGSFASARVVHRRWPAALALAAAVLGLAFASISTADYTKHLDRQVHDLHCSFVPGLDPAQGADTACRAAMNSPFSALLRDRYWGGVPIALFAVGAFAFFAAFATYLLVAGRDAPHRAPRFLAAAGVTPLAASGVMAFISATELGEFCKTCVGMYVASAMLAVAGLFAYLLDRKEVVAEAFSARRPAGVAPTVVEGGVGPTVVDVPADAAGGARRAGGILLWPAWLAALGAFAVTPSLLYVSALPSYSSYMSGCGALEKPTEPNGALLRISHKGATQPATLIVDPLCPTCRAFHGRLDSEGIFEQLDATLVLFPLDNECNWMLDRPVHPGACVVSKAVLCADARALSVLEWAYEEQDEILAAGKANKESVLPLVKGRFPDLAACIGSKETKLRLDRMLRWIVTNHLPVSTPQLFLAGRRLCDEDSDIGLPYAARKLAPGLRVQ